jgi:Na+/H+-dicarboxylate symporter
MIVCDATVSIVPLVLSSLSLALCSMADSKRLGKIVGKTIGTFVGFYVCGATAAGINITADHSCIPVYLCSNGNTCDSGSWNNSDRQL